MMWLTVSYVCFTLGGITLVGTVILSIKWDATNMIRVVTGRSSKRFIERVQSQEDLFFDRPVFEDSERSSHKTTQALLERSLGQTKDLKKKVPLTKSENIKPENKSKNVFKSKPITITENKNPVKQETPLTFTNKAYKTGEGTEILVVDEFRDIKLTEILNNQSDDFTVTGEDKDSQEKVEINDKTSVLSDEVEDKTSVLTDVVDDKTSVLTETDDSVNSSETNEVEEQGDSSEEFILPPAEQTSILALDDLESELEADESDKTGVLEVENNQEVEPDNSKTNVLDSEPEATSMLTETESESTTVLSSEDDTTELDSWSKTGVLEPVGVSNDRVEDVVEKKPEIRIEENPKPQPKLEGISSIIETPVKEIPIEVVNGTLESADETDQDDEGGKTEIISESEDYKKILKEDYESIEFYDFKVIEVVSSYDRVEI